MTERQVDRFQFKPLASNLGLVTFESFPLHLLIPLPNYSIPSVIKDI